MTVTFPSPSAGLASAILGFWQLVSREDFDAAGHRNIDPVLGADPLGVLCFARRGDSRRSSRSEIAPPPRSRRPVWARRTRGAFASTAGCCLSSSTRPQRTALL